MSILALTPNNKNQFRRYPLKQSTAGLSDEGFRISDEFVVNCSITSTYGQHRIYIKQIFRKGNFIKIAIAAVDDDFVLGEFSGTVVADFTTLNLIAYSRFVSGNLTLGTLTAVQSVTTTLNFSDPTATEFEESTIFCYTPPAVTSIRDAKNSEVRGFVNFGLLTNLSKATTLKNSNFTATNPAAVLNTADESTFLDNCSNPTIKSINTVVPFTPIAGTSTINDGNIYIAGVRPVVFYGDQQLAEEPTSGVVSITTEGLTLDKLCSLKHDLIPPLDITGFTLETKKNSYYNKPALSNVTKPAEYPYSIPDRQDSSFRQATLPEYYFWPQFVGLSYYADWQLLAPSAPTITAIIAGRTSLNVEFTPPKNSGNSSVTSYQYRLFSADLKTPGLWTSRGTLSTTSPIVISDLTENLTVGVQLRAVTAEGAVGIASYVVLGSTLSNHYYRHGNYWSDDQVLVNGSILYLTQLESNLAINANFTEGLFTITTNGSGVVTKAYTYNHQYAHGNYWSDDQELLNGISLLYAQRYGNLLATYINFIEGLYTVTTDEAGLVTKVYTYNHQYPHGTSPIYYSDSETLVNGSILYTTQYGNTLAANVQFIEDAVSVSTNSAGTVSVIYTYDHPYRHGSYWSNDSVLGYGSVLYTGQHNNTPATNVNFIEGEYTITTNGSGVVTKAYTYNNSFPHGNYFSSVETLADGSVLYTAQHSSSPAANVVFIEGLFTVSTNGSGVVTLSYTYNHQYPHGTDIVYYSDDQTLVNGSVLYTGIRTGARAASVAFVEGLNSIVTNALGVVTITYAYNHQYTHGNYYSDAQTLVNGSILYTQQYENTLAIDKTFTEELFTITTDGGGVVTKAYTLTHEYVQDVYFSDVANLINGVSILYLTMHGSAVAANISFNDIERSVSTNGSGVVTVNYTYTHQYPHGVDVVYWSNDQTLEDGSVLYTGQHNNTLAISVSFVENGYLISTDVDGIVSKDISYRHPYQHGNYWSDSQTLVTGVSVLYTGEHDTAAAANVTFTEGLYTITTNVNGLVTKDFTYNNTNKHGDYYSVDSVLVNGVSFLYIGQHTNTPAANTSFIEGAYTITTNGSGLVTKAYTYNHPYPHSTNPIYYSDYLTLVNGYVLYTGEHNNIKAVSVTFIEGEYTIRTNSSGVVTKTYTYNNSYSHGNYYSSDAALISGSYLYTGEHNNIPAALVSFTEGLFNIVTTIDGLVTKTYTYNFTNPHGGYYSSDLVLVSGVSYLYAGMHDNAPARNANFIEDLYKITTDNTGLVTKVFAYNHNYPRPTPYVSGTIYWSDGEVLANGNILYTGEHNDTLATLVSFTEGLFNITTTNTGAVSKSYKYTHQYPQGAYYSDYEVLANGQILYSELHGITPAANANFTLGDYTITTNSSGIVSKALTYPYNHIYQHGTGTIYYSDFAVLANGQILYSGRHVNTPAANVTFIEGLYTVETGPSGVVALRFTYTHQYTHPTPYVSGTIYYSDDEVLSNGSILYTGEHNSIKAASVTFGEALTTINTNYAGVVTITYRYTHPYSYPGVPDYLFYASEYEDFTDSNLIWSDDYPLVVGSVLYTTQHGIDVANYHLTRFGDFEVAYNSAGVVTSVVYAPILHPYAHRNGSNDELVLWGDLPTITVGSILYSQPDQIIPAPGGTYNVGTDIVTVSSPQGVVTSITYNHQYPHGIYWCDDELLVIGSILYTGRYNSTRAAATTITSGPVDAPQRSTTNSIGVVISIAYAYTWSYVHGGYYSGSSTLDNGSILYIGRHSNTPADGANFVEGLFIITTISGVVTKTPIINHQYIYSSGPSYYSDSSTLFLPSQDYDPIAGTGSPGTILYTTQYENTLAVNKSFIASGYSLKTNAQGMLIFKQYINHAYSHGAGTIYWTDLPSLEIGGVLFTEQHNNTRAVSVSFVDGPYTITSSAQGIIATKTYTVTHPYTYGTDIIYYSDDRPLVVGSIIYKTQHTNALAINVTFVYGLFTITTNTTGSVSSKAYTYTHQYPYGNYWSNDQTLTVGISILYTTAHTLDLAVDADFELDGYRITTGPDGIVTANDYIDHPHHHGNYWADNESLFTWHYDTEYVWDTFTLYAGRHTNMLAANITPFEEYSDTQGWYGEFEQGGWMISTDSSGVVTRTYIEHPYNYDYATLQLYWGDASILYSTNPLYTGKHTNVRAAAGYYEITGIGLFGYSTYAVVVDAAGVMSAVTPINHSVEAQDAYEQFSFWVDVNHIIPGTPIYTGQYTNTHPPTGSYVLNAYDIDAGRTYIYFVVIGTDGAVSGFDGEHLFPHGDYYSSDDVLVNGSMLYVAPGYLGAVAANITPFEESGNMISTDANGVVTIVPV